MRGCLSIEYHVLPDLDQMIARSLRYSPQTSSLQSSETSKYGCSYCAGDNPRPFYSNIACKDRPISPTHQQMYNHITLNSCEKSPELSIRASTRSCVTP